MSLLRQLLLNEDYKPLSDEEFAKLTDEDLQRINNIISQQIWQNMLNDTKIVCITGEYRQDIINGDNQMRTKQAAVKFFRELGMEFTANELDNRSDDWWQHHGEKYVQVIKVMSIDPQGYDSMVEEALNEDSKRWKWNV